MVGETTTGHTSSRVREAERKIGRSGELRPANAAVKRVHAFPSVIFGSAGSFSLRERSQYEQELLRQHLVQSIWLLFPADRCSVKPNGHTHTLLIWLAGRQAPFNNSSGVVVTPLPEGFPVSKFSRKASLPRPATNIPIRSCADQIISYVVL